MLIPVSPTTAEEVRGDWVLFHPVYTPEELRSVEVRDQPGSPSLYLPDLTSCHAGYLGFVQRCEDILRQSRTYVCQDCQVNTLRLYLG